MTTTQAVKKSAKRIANKTLEKANKTIENVKLRIQSDFVLKGKIVAIIKWMFLVLAFAWIITLCVDYTWDNNVNSLTKEVERFMFLLFSTLHLSLSVYIVYKDRNRFFLPDHPTPHEKYRTLIFWVSLMNVIYLSISTYKYFFKS